MLGDAWAARLGTAAEYFVPRELVTRPLPFNRLPLVDRAVQMLRTAGASETGPAAFGLHFNVEPPRLDAEAITAILKAFVLLNDWLRRESRPRRLSHRIGFGRHYPPAYVRRVLAEDYWPQIDDLIGDYLAANPTRNRDLDLLPLFLHFDEQRVRARLPNEKIGQRAVLHYRLPTARVSQPGWSIAAEWNRWIAVERLAANPARLSRLAAHISSPPDLRDGGQRLRHDLHLRSETGQRHAADGYAATASSAPRDIEAGARLGEAAATPSPCGEGYGAHPAYSPARRRHACAYS